MEVNWDKLESTVHRCTPPTYDKIKTMSRNEQDLLHAALGIAGESGELIDAVKKFVMYGQDLDVANVAEELGDCLWYICLACKAMDLDINEVIKMNLAKLAVRYPEQFTTEASIHRKDKDSKPVLKHPTLDEDFLENL